MSIVERLYEVAGHDWRTGHLAHTSDTAKEAAKTIERLMEVLKWYQERAVDLSGFPKNKSPEYYEAIFTELSLDAGKRADAALKAAKEDK